MVKFLNAQALFMIQDYYFMSGHNLLLNDMIYLNITMWGFCTSINSLKKLIWWEFLNK